MLPKSKYHQTMGPVCSGSDYPLVIIIIVPLPSSPSSFIVPFIFILPSFNLCSSFLSLTVRDDGRVAYLTRPVGPVGPEYPPRPGKLVPESVCQTPTDIPSSSSSSAAAVSASVSSPSSSMSSSPCKSSVQLPRLIVSLSCFTPLQERN
jgi:hypothetical protein